MTDYLRDPAEIYRRSFEIVRAEADLGALPDGIAGIALRLVHASGMPDIVPDLRWTDGVASAARAALDGGAPIICDGAMTASGILRASLPAGNRLLCMLDMPNVAELARRHGTTRSAAQVELWKPFLPGSLVVIGTAPTALFRLLEILAEDPGRRPAAIFGFPVGFVGAAESKEALAAGAHGVPFLALAGRLGGSAMAAAAVNAVLERPAA